MTIAPTPVITADDVPAIGYTLRVAFVPFTLSFAPQSAGQAIAYVRYDSLIRRVLNSMVHVSNTCINLLLLHNETARRHPRDRWALYK